MKRFHGNALSPIFASVALALVSCLSESTPPSTQQPPVPLHPQNGGGSDTETLTGLVTTQEGLAAIGVAVKLLPTSFDPSQSDTTSLRRTITDSLGRFRFEKVDSTASWNLIAGDPLRKAWSLAASQRVGDTVTLALAPAKVLLVTLHTSAYSTQDSGVAYFPGTDILTRCDGRSTAKVDSIPAAATRLVIVSRSGWRYDTAMVAKADTTKVQADKAQILITP